MLREFERIHGVRASGTGERIRYDPLYNRTEGFEDFVETFEQRLREQGGRARGSLRAVLRGAARRGAVVVRIISVVSSAASILMAVADWFRSAAVVLLTTLAANPPTMATYAEHHTRIDCMLLEGRKLLSSRTRKATCSRCGVCVCGWQSGRRGCQGRAHRTRVTDPRAEHAGQSGSRHQRAATHRHRAADHLTRSRPPPNDRPAPTGPTRSAMVRSRSIRTPTRRPSSASKATSTSVEHAGRTAGRSHGRTLHRHAHVGRHGRRGSAHGRAGRRPCRLSGQDR